MSPLAMASNASLRANSRLLLLHIALCSHSAHRLGGSGLRFLIDLFDELLLPLRHCAEGRGQVVRGERRVFKRAS